MNFLSSPLVQLTALQAYNVSGKPWLTVAIAQLFNVGTVYHLLNLISLITPDLYIASQIPTGCAKVIVSLSHCMLATCQDCIRCNIASILLYVIVLL
jgi:hypothetical protein